MAIIPQQQLFGWEELEGLGDLERLRLVLEYMPDEKLVQLLEHRRGLGRDDYPVRAMWNSTLAGVVYQHPSVESLRRELSRNGQLRRMCGFKGDEIPPPWAYSRFLANLLKHQELIDGIFSNLVDQCYTLLPGFGCNLALDGKAINSHARRRKEDINLTADGRRDLDANTGAKSYEGRREDGTLWQRISYWFGYKLHLIVDADYELPVAFKVTPASNSEIKEAHTLVDNLGVNRPEILRNCQNLMADRGYDDRKLLTKLWDQFGIRAIIDIRNQWKDGEKTRQLDGYENIVYDFKGTVYCCCPQELKLRKMAYAGLEADRGTLKYRCPARHYGYECKGERDCLVKNSIRVYMSENRRLFTPLPRASFSWEKLYKKRTAVERVNSRLDVSFGFEKHFIRGQKKMNFRCSLALCVMLAIAVGRVKEKKPELIRSLVRSA